MKCIEMIRLRASGRNDRVQALKVCQQIIRSNSSEQPVYTSLLTNTTLDTDLCICICWNKGHDRYKESLLGQQIEKGLSDFGLLNHSLWLVDENLFPSNANKNETCEIKFDTQWLKKIKPLEKIQERKNVS
jgi:hypothetical protein